MPTIHVFQAGRSDTLGYTHDPDGANLPRGIVRGSWEGSVRIRPTYIGQQTFASFDARSQTHSSTYY